MATDDLLFGDLYAALKAVQASPSLREWLARRGLPPERCAAVGGVGAARTILTNSTRTWEPYEEGERTLIAPVWDGPALVYDAPYRHPSPLIDLVAWRPTEPGTLFLRLGIGSVLGVEGLRQATSAASSLRLFRDVEDFIRYGGEVAGEYPAAVLLNPGMAYLHLRDIPAIIADDVVHGTELESLLEGQRPPLPPIRVPASAVRRAA